MLYLYGDDKKVFQLMFCLQGGVGRVVLVVHEGEVFILVLNKWRGFNEQKRLKLRTPCGHCCESVAKVNWLMFFSFDFCVFIQQFGWVWVFLFGNSFSLCIIISQMHNKQRKMELLCSIRCIYNTDYCSNETRDTTRVKMQWKSYNENGRNIKFLQINRVWIWATLRAYRTICILYSNEYILWMYMYRERESIGIDVYL